VEVKFVVILDWPKKLGGRRKHKQYTVCTVSNAIAGREDRLGEGDFYNGSDEAP
jgi:hypothetical protein